MSDSVYKVITLVGTSTESWEMAHDLSKAKAAHGATYAALRGVIAVGEKGLTKIRAGTLRVHSGKWTKRDAESGKFLDEKPDKPFRGTRKEK
jgi:hypothetical protein